MVIDIKKVKEQADFCLNLMNRLYSDIKEDTCTNKPYETVWYHTRKQADIIRLRRELNKLNKLLVPWGD